MPEEVQSIIRSSSNTQAPGNFCRPLCPAYQSLQRKANQKGSRYALSLTLQDLITLRFENFTHDLLSIVQELAEYFEFPGPGGHDEAIAIEAIQLSQRHLPAEKWKGLSV